MFQMFIREEVELRKGQDDTVETNKIMVLCAMFWKNALQN